MRERVLFQALFNHMYLLNLFNVLYITRVLNLEWYVHVHVVRNTAFFTSQNLKFKKKQIHKEHVNINWGQILDRSRSSLMKYSAYSVKLCWVGHTRGNTVPKLSHISIFIYVKDDERFTRQSTTVRIKLRKQNECKCIYNS